VFLLSVGDLPHGAQSRGALEDTVKTASKTAMNTVTSTQRLSAFALSVLGLTAMACELDAAQPHAEELVSALMAGDTPASDDATKAPTALELAPPVETPPAEASQAPATPTIAPAAPPWFSYDMAHHGGNGGNLSPRQVNGLVYGVLVRGAQYVDQITFLYYRPSQPDNYFRPGDQFGTFGPYGGTGGYARSLTCPPNQVLVGIRGRSGTLIDSLGIVCSDAKAPDPWSPANYVSPVVGGAGGYWFDDRCANNYLIYEFNVRSSRFLNALQGRCIRAQ
jgi:hypothetical protein